MATIVVESLLTMTSLPRNKLDESLNLIKTDGETTDASDESVDDDDCDDDSDSQFSDSDSDEYSSDDYDSEDDKANAALEQELRMNMTQQAHQRAGGVFVSSVLGNLLKQNASDSNLSYLTELTIPVQHVLRRGSANDILGSSNHLTGEARLAMCIQTSLPTQTFYDKCKGEHPMANTNPMETLKAIRLSLGRTTEPVRNETVRDFFEHKEEHIAAYDLKVMTAVRSNDLEAIYDMFTSGKELQCCNRFYESILHTVARRGLADMLDFLLTTAKLNLRVCCASGRTPLHDACWTASPNFTCIKRILHECPDFLLVADNRNFSPLNYVPRDCWGEWNDFIKANSALVAGCWFM